MAYPNLSGHENILRKDFYNLVFSGWCFFMSAPVDLRQIKVIQLVS